MSPRLQIAAFAVSVALLVAALVFTHCGAGRDADVPPTAPPPVRLTHPRPIAATDHPAPFEAFAQARAGDWYAYGVVSTGSLVETHTTAMVVVSAVSDASVVRTMRGRIDATGAEPTQPSNEFPRAGLTLERLDGDDVGGWTLFDVATAPDQHVVGGRPFECTKVTFGSRDPMFPAKRTRTELWLSPLVPAGGLVAEREEQHLGDLTFVQTEELIGFGTADGTVWGTRPAGW
jgi:hypothetical protein